MIDMTSLFGQTILHYKILEKLGEGGMGVVYKAHDITLDRDVALKFLPRDVSLSEEDRSRFIHEAKAASALDHPNICTIHEVATTDDGQMFIAMGYYEGVSLNKKIQKGRLDLEEAVAISIQIAEGLQAAHEKGIVHRDVKSGNIIITEKGQVKILDFGLAHKSGLSRLTRTGTTVGTASYMSPEQAKGEKVDQRSDLWSLGVVLYEMVTGKLPFRGEHEAAILYSVVNEEPKPLEVSISGTSPELIHIIGRALEKNVAERYQSAAEMLVDLKRLKKETSRTGYKPIGTASSRSSKRRKRIWMVIGAGILLVAAVAFLIFFQTQSNGINPEWKQHSLQIPYSDIHNPGISGDGNWVGFSAADRNGKWGLYLMNARAGEPHLVTALPFATQVDVSADGSLLLYTVYSPKTDKTDGNVIYSTGGVPRRIIQGGCFGPRFRPDGKRVGYILGMFPSESGSPSPSGKLEFWSVGIDGNDPHREFIDSLSRIDGSVSFCYSPDGRKVAWLRTCPEKYQEIVIHVLETGQENLITSDKKNIDELAWAREDHIIYSTDRNGIFNVWMVPAAGGEPIPITNGVEKAYGVKSSTDGQRIIYKLTNPFSDFWIVNIAENRSQQIRSTEETLVW
jgi:serine/threonine protein kinase